MKNFWRELVIIAMCFIVVELAIGPRTIEDVVSGLGRHVTVLLLSSSVGLIGFLILKRREIQILLSVHRIPGESMRGAVSLYVRSRIEQVQEVIRELTHKDGVHFESNELKGFVNCCFHANKNSFYIGTDSNVPSVFKKNYPTYLQEHFASYVGRGPRQDVRFIFASEHELREDFAAHEFLFRDFVNAHVNHSVALLQVEQSVADEAAALNGFPSTDIGLFGVGFVAFFRPSDNPPGCWVSLQSVDRSRKEMFEYLRHLNHFAKEIRIDNTVFGCALRKHEDIEAVERSFRTVLHIG